MEREATGKTYEMKGHTLPGINQRSDATATNVAEQGLAGSSAFQQVPPPLGVQQPFPPPPVGGAGAMGTQGVGMGAMGAQGVGMTPPLVSKPSMAKIYNKSKLTKKVLK